MTTEQTIATIRMLETTHGPVKRLAARSVWGIAVHYADGHKEQLHSPRDTTEDVQHGQQRIADAFPAASVRMMRAANRE